MKRYANSNPFFKKGKEKPTYAEAVKSQQKQYHHHQNRPVNDYVQNVQHNQRRYIPNDNRNTQNFRRYHHHINKNRLQERGFTPKSFFKMQDKRQYDVPSLLSGPLMPRTRHNGRGRGRQYNISNNSEWLDDEDAVNHDSSNSFFVNGQKLDLPIINDGNLAETGKIFTKIYNLSNRKLNDIEKSVLMMGLKFTPTPEKK